MFKLSIIQDCIKIPTNSRQPNWYLSNDSKYGFIESDVYWPTVTHFLEAKKFEGTQYEEIIRNTVTVLQAKKKTRERDACVEVNDIPERFELPRFSNAGTNVKREVIYGKKNLGFKIKPSWQKECVKHIRTAITSKFTHNPKILKILLSTYPKPIKCDLNDKIMQYTANILMIVRAIKLRQINEQTKKQNIKTIKQVSDILNSEQCSNIRLTLMYVSKYISQMEGWDRVFPEMILDAVFNISPKLEFKKTNKRLTLPSLTSEVGTYVTDTRKCFIHIDRSQKETDVPSKKIVQFIMWCIASEERFYKIMQKIKRFTSMFKELGLPSPEMSIETKMIMKGLDKITPEIIIPPGRRWYRNNQPPKITSNKELPPTNTPIIQ